MQLAKDRAKDNDLGGAEGYRTMAESIHETSKTLSVGGVNIISLHVDI